MTESTTDLFLALTPDRVLDGVEAAGLRCTGLCYPLNSFENRVYEVELDDGSRVIAKFYRPGRWTAEQILEEHQFLTDLQADEVPVCEVRPFPDGSTLKRQGDIYYTLADRRGGRAPDELNHDAMVRLGRLVARMHNVAVTRPAEHRWTMSSQRFIHDHLQWLDDNEFMSASLRDRFAGVARDVAAALDDRMQGVTLHRIHGDLHLSNLLLRGGVLHMLDFDDMVVGPAVQDLWLALPGRDEYATQLRTKFLEGYEEFRDFDRTTLRLIEPLRAMRMIHFSGWLARRWHDPIFPATWSHFGTDRYWEEAIIDLMHALRHIAADDPKPNTGGGEPDLTNTDFFWDM